MIVIYYYGFSNHLSFFFVQFDDVVGNLKIQVEKSIDKVSTLLAMANR